MLIAFVTLAAFFLVAIAATVGMARVFRGLQKEVAAALIAGTATVLVSVGSVVLGRYLQRRQEIEQSIREQKIPMYEEFVGFWFMFMMQSKFDNPIPEAEVLDYMMKFTKTLMVWGSDDVIVKWSAWRNMFASGTPADPAVTLFEFESVLLAIRREFGHKNRGFQKGSLLSLFVNDLPAVSGR